MARAGSAEKDGRTIRPVAPPPLPTDPLPDEGVARAVRKRTGVAAAVSALVFGPMLWVMWDGSLARIAIPAAGAAYVFFLLARVASNPLRYPHLARRSPLQRVLDSRGVPEVLWARAATPSERSVVVGDLLDELGAEAERFWHRRFGKSLGRVIPVMRDP